MVIEKGADVTSINVGDRVAARKPHHQYVTAEEDELVLIPAGVSDEDATWFGLANITFVLWARGKFSLLTFARRGSSWQQLTVPQQH